QAPLHELVDPGPPDDVETEDVAGEGRPVHEQDVVAFARQEHRRRGARAARPHDDRVIDWHTPSPGCILLDWPSITIMAPPSCRCQSVEASASRALWASLWDMAVPFYAALHCSFVADFADAAASADA